MTPFVYHALDNIQAALTLFSDNGQPLAGGTGLFLRMERRQSEPSVIVDLKRIPGLDGLERARNEVRIGALTVMQGLGQALSEACT